jgi:hypothetical protein
VNLSGVGAPVFNRYDINSEIAVRSFKKKKREDYSHSYVRCVCAGIYGTGHRNRLHVNTSTIPK